MTEKPIEKLIPIFSSIFKELREVSGQL